LQRPCCLWCDLAVCYFFPVHWSALFWAILLIVLAIQFAGFLHVGSLLSCQNFQSVFLCQNRRFRTDRLYFSSHSAIFLAAAGVPEL
jgi:hypothetical protein